MAVETAPPHSFQEVCDLPERGFSRFVVSSTLVTQYIRQPFGLWMYSDKPLRRMQKRGLDVSFEGRGG